MSTIRLQIRDKLIEYLNADRPVGIPEAENGKWRAGEESKIPRICVSLSEEPQNRKNPHFPVVERDLQILISCGTQVDAPSEAEDAVEPMLTWVEKIVSDAGAPIRNLNGLVHDMRVAATKWEHAQIDGYYVCATIAAIITYQTRRGDPESKQ